MQGLTRKQSKLVAGILAIVMLITCFSFMQTTTHAATKEKTPYKKGDNIKNAVFYIGVDANGDGDVTDSEDAVYYYTYKEIKDAGEEVAYHYGNHGQGETASVKGAKVSTLLKNLSGVTIKDSWTVQYMEEDAYHATNKTYQDTVKGLTDEEGTGNGSGAAMAAESIVGYAAKTTYDAPDANNVNETSYTRFLDYEREASYVRGYRQTDSANSSVLKMLKGVVISNDQRVEGAALPTGKCGYNLKSIDASRQEIADGYQVLGLLEGMVWPVTPNVDVPWATLDSHQTGNWNGTSKLITVAKDTQDVSFRFTEKAFFKAYENGSLTQLTRSNIEGNGYEFPTSNAKEGVNYTYFGYNKPMYIRYQGVYLNNLMNSVNANDKVYIVKADGTKVDITDRVGDFFVACYYSQSKSSSNISNKKRVPLNYDYSVLVDTASAPLEYSNGEADYTVESGKSPTIYQNAVVSVVSTPDAVTNVTASLKTYNSVKVKWNKVADADGYKVYYKTGNSGWKSTTAKSTSATLSKLTKGKSYEVRVKAYCKSGDVTAYSKTYSATKKVTTLKAVTLKVKKSKNKAKISFTNIAGESGYQVYAKTGNGKWKLAKTLKTNKTTWTGKTLKKGRTDSYKVRAYKTVDGKKIYGPWSSVKKATR